MTAFLTNSRELDWPAVDRAAKKIQSICSDAGFSAPEDLFKARELIVKVCAQLDAITKALLITPPGAK